MENELEPKPGSLRSKWMDHEEPVPSQAWEGIESRMRKRKRRPFLIWWFFGGLALLTCAYLVLYKPSQPPSNEAQALSTTSGQQQPKADGKIPASPQNVKPAESQGVVNNKTASQNSQEENSSSLKPIERTSQPETPSLRKKEKVAADLKSVSKNENGSIPQVALANDAEPEPNKESVDKTKRLNAIRSKAKEDLLKSQVQIPLEEQDPDSESGNQTAESTEEKIAAAEKVGETSSEEKYPASTTDSEHEKLVDAPLLVLKNGQLGLLVIQLPQPAKVPLLPVSESTIDTTSKPRQNRKAGWEFCMALGSMSQSVQIQGETVGKYQSENLNRLVYVNSSSIQIPILAEFQLSWHFPVFQSVWLGGTLRSTFIHQKNRFRLRPGVNSGTRFLPGDDSLSFTAQALVPEIERSFVELEIIQEALLHLEWAPKSIPLRFRLNWAGFRQRTRWQSGSTATDKTSLLHVPWPDVRLACPISRRSALALQFRYQTGINLAIPMLYNTGDRLMYSVGYVWEF